MNIAYKYDVQSGTSAVVYALINFAFPSRYLEIDVLNNAATFRFQLQDGTFGGEIIYDPQAMVFPFIIPFKTAAFMIKSTDPALPADYQLVSWV